MGNPGSHVRIAGRYLVVPMGTVFPRECVRTGRLDDLREIDETVGTPGVILKSIGALRYFGSNQEGRLRYYVNNGVLRGLARWHRTWMWATLVAIAGLLLACAFYQLEAAAVAMVLLCGSIGTYIVRPMPLNVAAVRDGEVFLLGVPKEIIAAMTGGGPGRDRDRVPPRVGSKGQ